MLWYIRLSYIKLKFNGIPIFKFMNLCKYAEIDIVEEHVLHNGRLSKNPYFIVRCMEDPKELIMRIFNKEERNVKAQVKQIILSTSENEYQLPNYPELYRNAYYNYAYAEGDKIVRKLMRHPDLDNKLILPNNPNEICDIFGIEAARLFMVREYVTLIKSSDSYVTPVNKKLLVDYQTTMGFLTPIHAIGSSKQGNIHAISSNI